MFVLAALHVGFGPGDILAKRCTQVRRHFRIGGGIFNWSKGMAMSNGSLGSGYIILCSKGNNTAISYVRLFAKWASLHCSYVLFYGFQSPAGSEGSPWNAGPQGPQQNTSLLTGHPLPFFYVDLPFFLRPSTLLSTPTSEPVSGSFYLAELLELTPPHLFAPQPLTGSIYR